MSDPNTSGSGASGLGNASTTHPEVVPYHTLTGEEYEKVLKLLHRKPNATELAIFSAMWSEHCSYKSSKPFLKRFPTKGERVVHGPGENAGVVDIGDGWVAVFKIESHNHPSYIEPFQGAATGVGGILRDIFTMGARPVALLNSLRFGPLERPKNRYLMERVVAGIAAYGNCVGVPTVGGEIVFNETYSKNPLVNVFCLGLAKKEEIVTATAGGVGNPVIYVGSKTGRDGVHGATMASAALDESIEDRHTVQVGDPFTETRLIEACLELIHSGALVGIQDMGAAGLTSSATEMADRGGCGIEIDLAKVPLREEKITPPEIMISESQERMLLVAKAGREAEVTAIFERWDLDVAQIGRVTDDHLFRVKQGDQVVAEIPVKALTAEAPVYDRPVKEPAFQDMLLGLNIEAIPEPTSYSKTLLTLLGSPNFASKKWVYRQYDHMIQTNTVVGPGQGGAAMIRLKGTHKALAMTTDGNSTYALLNPYFGGAIAVAEAARNLACVGALPIGMTNCLNFGNPERPETMWSFGLAVEGMADACTRLEIPVVSGNVSLYNETLGLGIYPTPIVGMVGLIDSADLIEHPLTPGFKAPGEKIVLIGDTREELGGTAYLKIIHNQERGYPPNLDFEKEKAVQTLVREAAHAGLLRSAQDCSEGGLAIALAECCLLSPSKAGGKVVIAMPSIRLDGFLFGESQSRVLVSVKADDLVRLRALAEGHALSLTLLGETGGNGLEISVQDEPRVLLHLSLEAMSSAHEQGITHYFEDHGSSRHEEMDTPLKNNG